MFATMGRSWKFAKISYGLLWDFKHLIVFPILSTAAAGLVTASFVLPLWTSGTAARWLEQVDSQGGSTNNPAMWALLFLFYFCNYFVIVFFNSALTACAMKVVSGEAPTVGYGLSAAGRRLPQIIGWALLSAVVGVALKMIENANEKAGRFIAAILGSAWTALTYFIVPVIVMDGLGPVAAFKRSTSVMKSTWGEALMGNFSLGWFGFITALPVLLVVGLLLFLAAQAQSAATMILVGAIAVIAVVLVIATTSAADVVFKALLFNYATGKSVPSQIDTADFPSAFTPK